MAVLSTKRPATTAASAGGHTSVISGNASSTASPSRGTVLVGVVTTMVLLLLLGGGGGNGGTGGAGGGGVPQQLTALTLDDGGGESSSSESSGTPSWRAVVEGAAGDGPVPPPPAEHQQPQQPPAGGGKAEPGTGPDELPIASSAAAAVTHQTEASRGTAAAEVHDGRQDELSWPAVDVPRSGGNTRVTSVRSQRTKQSDGGVGSSGGYPSMEWQFESCASASAAPPMRGRERYEKMRGLPRQCVFAAHGKWSQPIDADALEEHAEALAAAVASKRRPRFCTPQHLRQNALLTQYVGGLERRQRAPDGAGAGSAWTVSPDELTKTGNGTTVDGNNPDAASHPAPPGGGGRRRKDPLDEDEEENETGSGADGEKKKRPPRDFSRVRLRHASCDLPDPEDPYGWLVQLTAAAKVAGDPHPAIVFVGDSVHRNLFASMVAVMRGQLQTVIDRQTHNAIRYVITPNGDCWDTGGHVIGSFRSRGAGCSGAVRGPILLELCFAPSFGHKGEIPGDVLPVGTSKLFSLFTGIVGGAVLHMELCDRGDAGGRINAYAQSVVRFSKRGMPGNQTYVYKGCNTALPRDPRIKTLSSMHDWKDSMLRVAAAESAAVRDERHNTTMVRDGGHGGTYFLDALELHESKNDAGYQRVHRQLGPVDHVHYTCVAHEPLPKTFNKWEVDEWQCRSLRDVAHASLVTAMIAARLAVVPPLVGSGNDE